MSGLRLEYRLVILRIRPSLCVQNKEGGNIEITIIDLPQRIDVSYIAIKLLKRCNIYTKDGDVETIIRVHPHGES